MAKQRARRQYTDADRASAIAYAAAHDVAAAATKWKVAKSQIYQWRTMARTADEAQRKGNGGGKTFEEGSNERMAQALRWLGQWKSAQLKHIRAGDEDTAYDIFAEHAFRVLKGEE